MNRKNKIGKLTHTPIWNDPKSKNHKGITAHYDQLVKIMQTIGRYIEETSVKMSLKKTDNNVTQ